MELSKSKGSVPQGPYIIAVSVVSPFLKFKNASKETIDASEELVNEIRKALMKAGNGLSRHIRKEAKAQDLENKIKHIERFGPILVDTLCNILKTSKKQKEKATEGLEKILGRDNKKAEKQLQEFEEKLNSHLASRKGQLDVFQKEDDLLLKREQQSLFAEEEETVQQEEPQVETKKKKTNKKSTSSKKSATKKKSTSTKKVSKRRAQRRKQQKKKKK